MEIIAYACTYSKLWIFIYGNCAQPTANKKILIDQLN